MLGLENNSRIILAEYKVTKQPPFTA